MANTYSDRWEPTGESKSYWVIGITGTGICSLPVLVFCIITIAMKKYICSVLLLTVFTQLRSQTVSQLWLGYFNQTYFTKHLGVWFDGHLRYLDVPETHKNVEILRLGLSYRFKEKYQFTAGGGYIFNQPSKGYEWRPWQQIAVFDKVGQTKLTYWLRYEQRFRYSSSDQPLDPMFHRLRLNLLVQYPIIKKEEKDKLYAVLNNELFLQYGTHFKFDQNRSFLGVAALLNGNTTLQAGYLFVFKNNAAPADDERAHGLRVNLFHRFDLKK